MENFTLYSQDHTAISAYRWAPYTPASAVIILLHGLGGHALSLQSLAQPLSLAGLDVYALTLRGHAANGPEHSHPTTSLGPEDSWQRMLEDIHALYAHVQQQTPERPVILYGQSMGSYLAQALLQQPHSPFAGAILGATNAVSPLKARAGAWLARLETRRLGYRGDSRLMHKLTYQHYAKKLQHYLNLENPSWYSSLDNAATQRSTIKVGTWRQLLPGVALANCPYKRRLVATNIPLFIAGGGDDPMGQFGRGPQQLAKAYYRSGQRNITLRIYEKSRHGLLKDRAAEAFIHDIQDWLGKNHFLTKNS